MSGTTTIAVLGGGAWGTALAVAAGRAGHRVRLWARDEAAAASINAGANPRYLPGIALDPLPEATTRIGDALADATAILVVTPAQTLASVLAEARQHMASGTPLVLCAKGIARDSGERLSEIAARTCPDNPVAALSGPSFATDVARGLPTAVTVASENAQLAVRLATLLSSPQLRCYSSDDLVGVEIGGALKNVMAIAAGAVAGAGLGASAQAAIVTRGFVELGRMAASFGARPETLMGLSGLGDLFLTCGSAQSRNFAYGLALGRGEDLEGRPLAEGVATAAIAARIARDRGIEAPITQTVDAVLAGAITLAEAVDTLLARPLRSEAG